MERIFFCGECKKFFYEECDDSVCFCKCKNCKSEITIACNLSKKEYDDYNEDMKIAFKTRIKFAFPSSESIVAEHKKYYRKKEDEERAIQAQLADSEKQKQKDKKDRELAQILVTSAFNFDGYRIVKYSGYISGDDAMTISRSFTYNGGNLGDSLLTPLSQMRRNALRKLKEIACERGCNAVTGVDFDYITLDHKTPGVKGTMYHPYVFCVTANGNAVIIEKIED